MSATSHLSFQQWEGVIAADFTLDAVRRHAHPLARSMRELGMTCLIAHDTRFMSALFAHDLQRLFESYAVKVQRVSSVAPLPAVYRAAEAARNTTALIVSARNRPYWYNGLVVLAPTGSGLAFAPRDMAPPSDVPTDAPTGGLVLPANPQQVTGANTVDVRRPYLDDLARRIDLALLRRSTLTIFVDPMHGTTAGCVPHIIGEDTQTRAIEINRDPDPLFDSVSPLPRDGSLSRLCKLVRDSDSHIGLGFSADGTALRVVDKFGDIIGLCEMSLLLAAYLNRQYRHGGVAVVPAPGEHSPLALIASQHESWQQLLGFAVEVSNEPARRIAELSEHDSTALLVGCTTDGELVLGNFGRTPDALLAGLLYIELTARNGGSLRPLLDELYTNLGA